MTDIPPILEFDPDPEGIIDPKKRLPKIDIPERIVLCFFGETIESLRSEGAREVWASGSEMGRHPLYEIERAGQRLGIFHPGITAPLAGGLFDEVIALGGRKFIACGGAGALNDGTSVGHLYVPTSAIRDEGTSYHYLPPSREVEPTPEAVAAIEAVLKRRGKEYRLAKTWTTDGIYRETRGRVRRRREEGCATVEMEAAALFAVARFRGVTIGQILYAGDDVSGAEWDERGWKDDKVYRREVFEIAAEACLAL